MDDLKFTIGFLIGALFTTALIFIFKKIIFTNDDKYKNLKDLQTQINQEIKQIFKENKEYQEKKVNDLSLNIKNLNIKSDNNEIEKTLYVSPKTTIQNEDENNNERSQKWQEQ